jgi:hypothetical protein
LIQYDDVTRDITALCDAGNFYVRVRVNATTVRTVAFLNAGAQPDRTVDFEVPADGQPHIIVSNVNSNQVDKIVSPRSGGMSGLVIETAGP